MMDAIRRRYAKSSSLDWSIFGYTFLTASTGIERRLLQMECLDAGISYEVGCQEY